MRRLLTSFQLIVLSIFEAATAAAQVETIPVIRRNPTTRDIEEYSVLITNKDIRHGPYARYQQNVFAGVVMFESGTYDQGQKEGEWLVFREYSPWNKLISKGNYHARKPEGWWTYYQLLPPNSAGLSQTTVSAANANTGYLVNITDTSAVIQAYGQYALGKRIGLWTYYDTRKQVVQKVNHFTNQLLYWRQADGVELAGSAADTHPVLYVGGKSQLEAEIYHSMNKVIATIVAIGRNNVAEFVFNIDGTGQLTNLTLASNSNPSRYEKVLLKAVADIPATWLPQSDSGNFRAGEYRVRITTKLQTPYERQAVLTRVEALGK